MSYKAFMSYSHEKDNNLAPSLQSALHRFAKSMLQIRAIRVFRDETNLSINPALWSEIKKALGASEYFLLLASPEAASSKWVRREIDYWCEHASTNKILIILTEGELKWDSTKKDFDWNETTALPRNLQKAFSEEPLYVDLRWAKTKQHFSLNNPKFRNSVAKIASKLHDKPMDELVGDDLRQHQRIIQLLLLIFVLLVTLTSIAGWQANIANQQQKFAEKAAQEEKNARKEAEYQQLLAIKSAEEEEKARKEAERQQLLVIRQKLKTEHERNQALLRLSKILVFASLKQTEDGKTTSAMLLALKALSERSTTGDRTYSAQAEAALYKAVSMHHDSVEFKGQFIRINNQKNMVIAASYYNEFLSERRIFSLRDIKSGKKLWNLGEKGQYGFAQHLLAIVDPDNPDLFFDYDIASNRQIVAQTIDTKTWKLVTNITSQEIPGEQFIKFSPNGKMFLTSKPDNSVAIRDSITKRKLTLINGKTGQLDTILFTPNGRKLITVSKFDNCQSLNDYRNDIIDVWSVKNGNRTMQIKGFKHALYTYTISPNSKLLASTSVFDTCEPRDWFTDAPSDYSINIWNLETGNKIEIANTDQKELTAMGFSLNSKMLVVGFKDGTMSVWKTETGKRIYVLKGHTAEIVKISFNPDGDRIITASLDRTAKVWNIHKGDLIQSFNDNTSGIVNASFYSDGNSVITASINGKTKLINPRPEQEVLLIRHGEIAKKIAFDKSGKRIAIFSDSTPDAWWWDIRTSKRTSLISNREIQEINNKMSSSLELQNGFYVDYSIRPSNWLRLTVSPDGDSISRFAGVKLPISRVFVDPSGRFIVSLSENNIIQLWDQEGVLISNIDGHTARIVNVRFSADGSMFASFTTDSTVQLWDSKTGMNLSSFSDHTGKVQSVAFSDDGERLATLSEDKTVKVWLIYPRGAKLIKLAKSKIKRSLTIAECRKFAIPFEDHPSLSPDSSCF